MTPDQNHPPRQAGPGDFDLTTWLAGRLDRLERSMEDRISVVLDDARDTRHTQRGTIGTMVAQVAVLVETVHTIVKQQEADRAEIAVLQAWRNRVLGVVALLIFLFPVTVTSIVAVAFHVG